VQVQEVNRLLNQFEQMQTMMKRMPKGGLAKMLRGMASGRARCTMRDARRRSLQRRAGDPGPIRGEDYLGAFAACTRGNADAPGAPGRPGARSGSWRTPT
jgi:hypothetical protein